MKKEITLQAPTAHVGFDASEFRSRVAASFRSIKSKYIRFFGLEDCVAKTEHDKWENRTLLMVTGTLVLPFVFILPMLYCVFKLICLTEKESQHGK